MHIRIFIAVLAALSSFSRSAQAQTQAGVPRRTWQQEKCVRYQQAWSQALVHGGEAGLGPEFLDGNKAFIAGGCTAQPAICPHSARELALVDILTIRVVNAGMSSTFLPFSCSKPATTN